MIYISDFYDDLEEREDEGPSENTSTIVILLNNIELMRQLLADKRYE